MLPDSLVTKLWTSANPENATVARRGSMVKAKKQTRFMNSRTLYFGFGTFGNEINHI